MHSLDRLSLADEIQKRAKKPIDCFVQVNTSLEPSKHGMAKEEVLPFVKKLSGYENIRIGRTPDEISVIAVTKYVSPERAQAALDAGIRHLGENRDTGLLHKLDVLKDSEPVWHFIGTLQTRKVKAQTARSK
ncbi:hypothetical protein DT075_23920 [Bacillus licheniformis]|nr:hypothetical protein DT075_23920 [Bacillus licheniformis]